MTIIIIEKSIVLRATSSQLSGIALLYIRAQYLACSILPSSSEISGLIWS